MQNIVLTRDDYVQIGAFLATIFGIVAVSYWLAARLRMDEDAVLMILFGTFLLVATLTRIPFFWYHAKALLLRSLLGDSLATIVYLVMGAGLVVGGGMRWTYWRKDVQECQRLYAQAPDAHERMRVLAHVPRVRIEGALEVLGTYQALTCGRYRERGMF